MKPEPMRLAEDFLAMLAHERAASPHTLRAYRREVGNFAAYLAEQGVEVRRVDHLQIRSYLGELYDQGTGQGLGSQIAGRHPLMVSLVGQGWTRFQ